MEVKEEVEGDKGNDVTLRGVGDIEFLTHDAEPSGKMIVDARNGFNDLSRLAMLWTMRCRWPAGARFAFNCYSH